jgi:hypothetical protein
MKANMELIIKVASIFCSTLNSWLTEEEQTAILDKLGSGEYSKGGKYENCCPTQEYCDANEAMIDAIERAVDEEWSSSDDEMGKLWDEAWERASTWNFNFFQETCPSCGVDSPNNKKCNNCYLNDLN